MPMVMITGQKGIMTSRQAPVPSVDMIATMRPLTKCDTPDCQRGYDPDFGPRRLPGRDGRTAGTGSS